MTSTERQALIDDISSKLSDCNRSIEVLRTERAEAIAAIPAMRAASIAYGDALGDAEAKLAADMADASRDYEAAFLKAGQDKQRAEQAADDVRANDPAERSRLEAIDAAQFAYQVKERELRQGNSLFYLDAQLKTAGEARDVEIEKAERVFRSASLKADEVRRKAYDAAASAQDAAIRTADAERAQKEMISRQQRDTAVKSANQKLAHAVSNNPTAVQVAATIDAKIEQCRQECETTVERLQARLRQLATL